MKLDKEHLKIAEVYWVDSIAGSGWKLTEFADGITVVVSDYRKSDCFLVYKNEKQ